MQQILTFDHPIPSCNIYSLDYNKSKNKWLFNYSVETPEELTNSSVDLIIYEYISDLILKRAEGISDLSVNIHIHNLKEYRELLETQYKEDMKYRANWIKNNPQLASKDNLNTIKMRNMNYSNKDLKNFGINYISFEAYKDDTSTIFAAI